jgi:hypothetical protein
VRSIADELLYRERQFPFEPKGLLGAAQDCRVPHLRTACASRRQSLRVWLRSAARGGKSPEIELGLAPAPMLGMAPLPGGSPGSARTPWTCAGARVQLRRRIRHERSPGGSRMFSKGLAPGCRPRRRCGRQSSGIGPGELRAPRSPTAVTYAELPGSSTR